MGIRGQELRVDAENLGKNSKGKALKSHDASGRRVEKRIDVKTEAAERPRPGQQPRHRQKTEDHQGNAGVKEKPARAVDQKEP